MKAASIFTDFLADLGVPHTRQYSDVCFDDMTFRSLFGFSKLLDSYGIPNEALELPNKTDDIYKLPVPFLARTADSFVIVHEVASNYVVIDDGAGDTSRSLPVNDFIRQWTGVVLVAYPTQASTEPSYYRHHIFEMAARAKRWVLAAAAAFIFIYLFIANGIYAHASTVGLTLIFAAGLYVTYELTLKSLNIHSDTGDTICGLIDRAGCHTVLSTKASSFFGLFGWSEVGLAYFGVSLGCLLVFPRYLPYLALINACCCPFSFWSIWYQKYRAKAWCTLCLITQGCLWGALVCFAAGGWFSGAFPLYIEFFVLCATYVAALLAVNAISPLFDHNIKNTPEK